MRKVKLPTGEIVPMRGSVPVGYKYAGMRDENTDTRNKELLRGKMYRVFASNSVEGYNVYVYPETKVYVRLR